MKQNVAKSIFQVNIVICLVLKNQAILDMDNTEALGEETFNPIYPGTNISRFPVAYHETDWMIPVPHYKPLYFTHPSVIGQKWADTENVRAYSEKFNRLDGLLDRRRNRFGVYDVDDDTGRPINPIGRTGLAGRGLLGRWGPNHAASLVVSRWFRESDGRQVIMPSTGFPLLEFVAVKFNGEWGIPGGFMDEGEFYGKTAQREFVEEALNGQNMTSREYKDIRRFFENAYDEKGHFVYQGYVKDNRNTDNAWIEGCVANIHDPNGDMFTGLELRPGDGAQSVKWLCVHKDMTLNPAHKNILKMVTDLHRAHW